MNTRPIPANPAPLAPFLPAPLSRAAPYVLLFASMVSFCFGTSFAKRLFPLVGAEGTAAYRVGFSALVLLIAFRPWRLPIERGQMLATMRYGAVLGLMNLSFYMALRTIPLGVAIAIEFLGPLSVALLTSHRPAHFVAIALACGGLVLLLPIHLGQTRLDPVGIAFALGAGLFWALYIVFGRATRSLPAGQAVSLGMATAALIVVPIGIHAQGATLLSPTLMLTGLMAALMSSSLPYSLELVVLKHIPPNRFGVLMSVDPALGALAGWIMLGEHLTVQQGIAIALVVAGSTVSVLAGQS